MSLDPKSPEFKLAKAKANLILEKPFYATLACNLPWVRDDSIPTMATDGKHVYWSGPFVDQMSLDECKFVVCHELLHCVFLHMHRLGSRDTYNWNVATDIVINDMLIKEGVGVMPKMGLNNPQLAAAGKYLAEEVYNLLPPPPPKNKQGGAGGNGQPGPLDQLKAPTGTQAEQTQAANDMKVMVAQAAQAAKMQGKLSAGLERLVGELLRPKVNWKDVLRNFLTVRAKVERSYARPNRRYLDQDMFLPSLRGEQMGDILVAVDCSGSIGQRELDEFATEITAIHQDLRPGKLHVIYFDSKIAHAEEYSADDTLNIRPHGGGGTAFSPIFKYATDNDLDPVACVVLTDLYCSDFGNVPDYPVLWCTNGATEAPFGSVVKME